MPKKEKILSELEVLAIDCQATYSNPLKGHILEIGWAKTRAAGSSDFAKIFNNAEAFPRAG